MEQILYPTVLISKEQNFQNVVIVDYPSITRIRFLIHKARRLERITTKEHRQLLLKNLHANLRQRQEIQRFIDSRQDGHTRKIKIIIQNMASDLKPVLFESLQVLGIVFSLWLIANTLHGVKL